MLSEPPTGPAQHSQLAGQAASESDHHEAALMNSASPEIPYSSMTPSFTEAATAQERSAHRESQEGGARWREAELVRRRASRCSASEVHSTECSLPTAPPQFCHRPGFPDRYKNISAYPYRDSLRARLGCGELHGAPVLAGRGTAARRWDAQLVKRHASRGSAFEPCALGVLLSRPPGRHPEPIGCPPILRVRRS